MAAGPPPDAAHGANEPASEAAAGLAITMFAADRASANLGMRLLRAGGGAAVVTMTVTALMVNGHGIAHGGYVFLLADTAFACACNSGGEVTVAAGADISFVTPVREGDELIATAAERVRYGRSGIYDVTVRRGDEVVAEFRGRARAAGQLDRPSIRTRRGSSTG